MPIRLASIMSVATLAFVFIPAAFAQPATQPAQTAPAVPDLLPGAIDPFDPGVERDRFLRRAGADMVLSKDEFAADSAQPGGFVRPFDRWETLAHYDADGSATIDWFEALKYREELRGKVFEAFDADKDKALKGAERDAANRALAAGAISLAAAASRPAAFDWRQRMTRQWDTDGDGQVSDEERQAAMEAMRRQRTQRMDAMYDTDGDGTLSDAEREAMQADRRQQAAGIRQFGQEWQLKLFDSDGDGQLSDQEQAASRQFSGQVGQVFRDLRRQSTDTDGDGQVSEAERQAEQGRMRQMAVILMTRAAGAMDADGDGQVSPEERRQFGGRLQAGMGQWVGRFAGRFDADGDGRFDEGERAALLAGFQTEMQARQKAADANRDGRLDAEESANMMTDFARELGIFPAARPNRTAP